MQVRMGLVAVAVGAVATVGVVTLVVSSTSSSVDVVAAADGSEDGPLDGPVTDGDAGDDAADLEARLAERRLVQEARAEEAREAREAARAERERLAEEEAQRLEEERIAEEERRQALVAAQERLRDLGYLIGAVDGAQGQQTTAALMAFQAVHGLQVDGILGPQTQAALDGDPTQPTLRGGPATRIEVDLDRQVLHLVEGGERTVTFKTSTGGGHEYTRGDGSVGVAVTPVGEFTITRRIAGERVSSAGLGILYDPLYFHGGFAIHGSNNVPSGPASAGCARLARADAVWLFDRVPNGTPVHLYGGQHTFTPRGA